MKYLLDTDAFSDIVRSVPNVAARFSSVSSSSVRISTVTTKKMEFGRRRRPERAARYDAAIDKLLKSIENWRLDLSEVREPPGEYRIARVGRRQMAFAA